MTWLTAFFARKAVRYIGGAILSALLVWLVVSAVKGAYNHVYSRGKASIQARWDADIAARQLDHQKALKQAADEYVSKLEQERAKEARMAQQIKEQDHAYQAKIAQHTRAAAALAADLERLRRTALTQPIGGSSGANLPGASTQARATGSVDAVSPERQLFATCADRYAGVATDAHQLRDQVKGLQTYVTGVCLAP